jgi:hypothetical protein
MKMFRTTSFLVFCFFIFSSHRVFAQRSNVTLSETVDWLQSKAHLITYVGANSLHETVEGNYNGKWEFVITKPCTIELRSEGPQLAPQASSDKQKSKNKSRSDQGRPRLKSDSINFSGTITPPLSPSAITIPLSSLNPQKVTTLSLREGFFPGGGSVQIVTTNGKEVIIWRGADKTISVNSITLGFKGDGMPARIAKALGHAISLCGGQVDKKEPF